MRSTAARRQFVLDTDDARTIFTARPVIDTDVDGLVVDLVDIQDFRQIPREPCICVGDCEGTRVRRCVMEDETDLGSGDQQ